MKCGKLQNRLIKTNSRRSQIIYLKALGTHLLMKNFGRSLLSLVMRNFNFVFVFLWSDKRSFSILSKTKAICPKDAGLSLVSFGWEEKKN